MRGRVTFRAQGLCEPWMYIQVHGVNREVELSSHTLLISLCSRSAS